MNYWTWNDTVNRQTRITWQELPCPSYNHPMYLACNIACGYSACYWCIFNWFKVNRRPTCLVHDYWHEQDDIPIPSTTVNLPDPYTREMLTRWMQMDNPVSQYIDKKCDQEVKEMCEAVKQAQESMRDRWAAAGRTFWITDHRRNRDVDGLFQLLATEISCLIYFSIPNKYFVLPCGHSMCYTCI